MHTDYASEFQCFCSFGALLYLGCYFFLQFNLIIFILLITTGCRSIFVFLTDAMLFFFCITVHSANYAASSEEERLGQLIKKLKNEGINPKEWKLGNFQRMLCPRVWSICFLQPCSASSLLSFHELYLAL